MLDHRKVVVRFVCPSNVNKVIVKRKMQMVGKITNAFITRPTMFVVSFPNGLPLTFWVCLVADKSNGFVRLHEYNKFGNTTGDTVARH
jgi:hypothetical protein